MRYDGTTLRDGEHDLIVYKVNKLKKSTSAVCRTHIVSVPAYFAGSTHTYSVTAAIILALVLSVLGMHRPPPEKCNYSRN